MSDAKVAAEESAVEASAPFHTELIPAQVPRRFPIGTMLGLIAVFAVLLSVLRTAGTDPVIIVLVAAFVLCVAVGQVVVFHGRKPRQASVVTGIAAWLVLGVGLAIFAHWQGGFADGETILILTVWGSFFLGGPAGYLVGGALAGVFLVAERIRTGQWNQTRTVEEPVKAEVVSHAVVYTLPTLHSERLELRPFVDDDAAEVQRLAGDAEVASTTALLPHPYPDGLAGAWIATHLEEARHRQAITLAIVSRKEQRLLGAIGLRLHLDQGKAELGYWIGRPYWNQGYATEAARTLLDYAVERFVLIQIFAIHMTRNPASGRVLQKLGMEHVGTLRDHLEKEGRREDCERYEILRYTWWKQGFGVKAGPDGRE